MSNAELEVHSIDKANKTSVLELQNKYGMIRNTLLPDVSLHFFDFKTFQLSVINHELFKQDFVPTESTAAKLKSEVSAYRPARRPETVPAVIQEEQKVRTVTRKPATVSEPENARTTSMSNNISNPAPTKTHSGTSATSEKSKSSNPSEIRARQQPTLTQSFFSAKKLKSGQTSQGSTPASRDETIKDQNQQSGSISSTKNKKDEHESEDEEMKDDDEEENAQVDLKDDDAKAKNSEDEQSLQTQRYKSSSNKKIQAASPKELDEDLKNMFADLEGDQEMNESKSSQKDEEKTKDDDVEMEDADTKDTSDEKDEEKEKEDQLEDQDEDKGKFENTNEPVTSAAHSSCGKKRVKKLIKTRAIDQLGYYTVHTEEVWVTEDEDENQDLQQESTQASNQQSSKSDSTTATTKPKATSSKPAAPKKSSKAKGNAKQGSLMSFFKK